MERLKVFDSIDAAIKNLEFTFRYGEIKRQEEIVEEAEHCYLHSSMERLKVLRSTA